VRLKLHQDGPRMISLDATKAGIITAGDIICDGTVEILNPDHYIATLSGEDSLKAEMAVKIGKGYVPAKKERDYDQPEGTINIDAAFSPIKKVNYTVTHARVGQIADYDRLIMEIWTNGTITPEMALVEAAKILRKHINSFIQYFELGEEVVSEEVPELEQKKEQVVDEELAAKLAMPIAELELSVRASNCLESAKIETVGQLAKMTEADLLKIRSFGKTSLREVQRKLTDIGLTLGLAESAGAQPH